MSNEQRVDDQKVKEHVRKRGRDLDEMGERHG